MIQQVYSSSLFLLTDLYQITMAYGYWKNGMAEREAVFNLFFRKNPFGGGYAIAAGLQYATDLMEHYRPSPEDIQYLSTLKGNDGKPLFEQGFLDYLAGMQFTCDVDAMPEGTVAFPHEPLLRIRGPLLQGQLLETPLLNMINFQTLIATKASRVCAAAQGDSVLEFGLRRAQGIDGGLSATRASYIGGVHATSNVLAGKLFGIPVRGTHAHAWVMSFPSEQEAFRKYADAMPNNCVFLVDTFDTLDGVRNAVEAGRALRAQGYELAGIRLDSGDLEFLSKEARRILDEGGFPNAAIVASNDLNENLIAELKSKGAAITVWGVGTQLATAYDQPALGGVYKLSVIRGVSGQWEYKMKLSEQPVKISNPGLQGVKRWYDKGVISCDVIYNAESGEEATSAYQIADPTKAFTCTGDHSEDLLIPVFRGGNLIYQHPPLADVRARALAQLASLPPGVRALRASSTVPAGLSPELNTLKSTLIQKLRQL